MTFDILMTMKANPIKGVTMEKGMPNLLALLGRNMPQLLPLNQRMTMCELPSHFFLMCRTYVCFYSLEITPPPTPSPIKSAGGKKCAMAECVSDDSDVFVPRYDTLLSVHYIQNIDNFNTLVQPVTVPVSSTACL